MPTNNTCRGGEVVTDLTTPRIFTHSDPDDHSLKWQRKHRNDYNKKRNSRRKIRRITDPRYRMKDLAHSQNYRLNNRSRIRERWNVWAKRTGYSKKLYTKQGKIMKRILVKSGYNKIYLRLWHAKIKPPKNFTMTLANRPWLKKGQWAWTFAHP